MLFLDMKKVIGRFTRGISPYVRLLTPTERQMLKLKIHGPYSHAGHESPNESRQKGPTEEETEVFRRISNLKAIPEPSSKFHTLADAAKCDNHPVMRHREPDLLERL